MNNRALISVLIIIVGTVFISVTAHAKNKNYICNVDQVGCYKETKIRVMLTEESGKFTQKWFNAASEREKEVLAILLSAIHGNMQVKINTDLAKSTPLIKSIFIIAP